MENYADFIKKHRIASGYKTQRSFAEATGISTATISRIEDGKHRPAPETIQAFAKKLHTTSLVELMVVCGYWDEDELLEPIDSDHGTETPTPQEISVPIEELHKQILTYKGMELTESQKKRLQKILLAALDDEF